MDEAPGVVMRSLPGEARSASLARRLVDDVLGEWQEEAAAEVASLLVSELVTNAVLHAGSEVDLVLRREPGRVRVEVGDRSPTVPEARRRDAEATIGRGLSMVELMAERWGVDTSRAEGKVVWFEVPGAAEAPPVEAPAGTGDARGAAPAEPGGGAAEVRLPDAPVRLMGTMQQHTEALLRELALYLLEMQGDTPARPGVDFSDLERQLQAAAQAGRTHADILLHVTPDALPEARKASEHLDHGDVLAAEGLLLCPPALPEVAGCRRWFLDQLINQLEGDGPEPWRPQPATMATPLPGIDDRKVLDNLPSAALVADDHNRILYLNAAAEALLGWTADELVGARVTTIVPERLHHAHVAGYTRYLLTGQARLIGKPALVPVRRRDGSEVEVELSLSALRGEEGRQQFTALLRVRSREPRTDTEQPAARDGVVVRLRSVIEHAAGLQEEVRRERVLAVLADELGWQFAAWWDVDGAMLRCVTSWQYSSELDPFVAATTERRFSVNEGLPGRVWATSAPAWLEDVTRDANFPRAATALSTGLRSGCAFPVIADHDLVGVVELLTTDVRSSDPGLLRALATVGRLLGRSG